MESRIKLAEAMGYKQDDKWAAWILQVSDKEREIVRDPDLLPDPFTDANDDYAVLEWMQVTFNTHEYLMGHQGDRWVDFIAALDGSGDEGHACCYKIGDYARAAFQVISGRQK